MKALPLWQPWASLVAIGAKRVETRHWPMPPALAGQRVAIHATKGTGPGGEGAFRARLNSEPFRSALAGAGLDSEPHRGLYRDPVTKELAPLIHANALPRGAIIATVVLDRCTGITEHGALALKELNPWEHAFGNYCLDEGPRFAWVLRDVSLLADPVPFIGSQGIFEVPDELLGVESPQGALL